MEHCFLNPHVTNGFSRSYHLDESTFIFRGIGSDFSFLFHFSMKIIKANRIALDGTPHFAASQLGLFYLPVSHKKDAILYELMWCGVFNYILKTCATLEDQCLVTANTILGNCHLSRGQNRWSLKTSCYLVADNYQIFSEYSLTAFKPFKIYSHTRENVSLNKQNKQTCFYLSFTCNYMYIHVASNLQIQLVVK